MFFNQTDFTNERANYILLWQCDFDNRRTEIL